MTNLWKTGNILLKNVVGTVSKSSLGQHGNTVGGVSIDSRTIDLFLRQTRLKQQELVS